MMKNARRFSISQRRSAFLLALLMLLSPVLGMKAQRPLDPVTISAAWTGADGTPQVASSIAVTYEGYVNTYWLYLPMEAVQADPAITVVDNYPGTYPGGFTLPQGQPLSQLGYVDAGAGLSEQPVYFQALDANSMPMADFMLYVSTLAPMPEPPAAVETPVPEPLNIPVKYIDQGTGLELLPASGVSAPVGQSTPVYAQPIEGYTPTQNEQVVTVDANGFADVSEVVFYYTANATPEPQPLNIAVKYIDQGTGAELLPASSVSAPVGQSTPVYAQPIEGYTPTQNEQVVTVDANGFANVSEVIFYYTANATPEPVPTAEPQPVSVPVYYRDRDSGLDVASAQSVPAPVGQETPVYAQPADLQPGYTLEGADMQTVFVDENSVATPHEIIFYYAKKALPILTIRFVDEATGLDVAQPKEMALTPGEHDILAEPDSLPDIYAPSGPTTQRVTATEDAVSPNTLTFFYKTKVSEPVDVAIHFLDRDNNPVATSKSFRAEDGTNTVKAEPDDLKEGYRLIEGEADTKYVIVQNNVADPAEVIFRYEYVEAPVVTEVPTPTPEPAPKVAIVTIFYRDQFGTSLINPPETITVAEGQPVTVQVDVSKLDSRRYEFTGAQEQVVTVDENGIAFPEQVVFMFKDLSVDRTAEVTVRYLDEADGEVAPAEKVLVKAGDYTITSKYDTAPEGYEAQQPTSQVVNLSPEGVLTPEEVIFRFTKLVVTESPIPEPTAFPYTLKEMEAYAYPRSNEINFRSEPQASGTENIIQKVGSADLMHITGSLVNNRDEVWYFGTINGVEGFLKQDVARILTEAETAAALGYTPVPSEAPTPSPTPVADGVALNLWGVANTNSLRFRAEPTTKAKVVADLKKGDKLFVYQQQTADNEKWYAAVFNGKEGFVMASFIDLMSQQESDQLQASLPSPAPVRTLPPLATEVPAATQTPVVTATPAPAEATATTVPVASASPAPYRGYALTTKQVPLRTGISESSEYILATLPQNAIVLISGQAYVEGVAWNHVDALTIKQTGYIPDSALRRIDPQEAQQYLNALQTTPTPTPARIERQVTGYGITIGSNVPMRSYYNTNAEIVALLGVSEVVQVLGQEAQDNITWHVVQYNGLYGFIRADQLRMMNPAETQNYLNSIRITPAPAVTPQVQLTQNSLSSYGYVNTDKVRLRREASTNAAYVKMMDKNAFALVLGSVMGADGSTWYKINQAGTEGYVMGSYFTVLPMNQLTTFLQSSEYLNANTGASSSGGKPASQITAVEDFNTQVWKNPSLAQVSYEPFNPMGSPTPQVEAILTPSPEPSASPEPTVSFGPLTTETPAAPTSSFPTGLLAIGLLAILGGGGYYAYYMYKQNQQRAAARSAKRRQQQAAADPQTRPAQPQGTAAYQPPRPRTPGAPGQPPAGQPPVGQPVRPGQPAPTQGAARPQPPQGTAPFRPTQPPQGTAQYRPGQVGQGTAQYRPEQPLGQGTAQFKPEPQTGQGTAQYRPAGQPVAPEQQGAAPAGTAQYKPVTPPVQGAPGPKPLGAQQTQQVQPPVQGAIKPDATVQTKPVQPPETQTMKPNTTPDTPAEGTARRRRRADRHDEEDNV